MKITTAKQAFVPLVITLETPEEVALMEAFVKVAWLNAVTELYPEVGFKTITDFASALVKDINAALKKEQNA